MIEILPFGEAAVLVNFKQVISARINAQVIALSNALEQSALVKFVVPSYCSIVVGFDSSQTDLASLKEMIKSAFNSAKKKRNHLIKHVKLPVCYHSDFALDMQEIQKVTRLKASKIIHLHSRKKYQVYGVGFLPGFPYLGKIAKALTCARRMEPRLSVPARSIGIAGRQTGIYPADTPGGWQIIGRTPIPIFRPLAENPFLLQPGDQVSIAPISRDAYYEMVKRVEDDQFDWKKLVL